MFVALSSKFGCNIKHSTDKMTKQSIIIQLYPEVELSIKMLTTIEDKGGKIDAIFYATSIHNDDLIRKPNTGMALKAKKQFPEIDFSRSIMIGNNISDMQFGRNSGMYTVFLKTTTPDLVLPHPDIDLAFTK